jgi:hypothetical protein
MNKAATVLLALIVALAAAAGTLLALGARQPAGQEARAREFQHLVGGLGFGPALDLERCPFSFDPRLAPGCAEDCGPVPGGVFFCPYHAGSLLDYSPPREDDKVTR